MALAAALIPGAAAPAGAAELQPHTVRAFDDYVRMVETRTAAEQHAARGFLGIDFSNPGEAPAIRKTVVSGSVYIARMSERGFDAAAIAVPDGLVNHWRGVVFVPGRTLESVLAQLRAPATARDVPEDVLESRLLWRDGDHSRIFLKLQRRKIVTVTYNTEHDVLYRQESASRAWSRSVSRKIAELEDAGTPAEREKPCGHDNGFMWRLNSYWRYEQVPGGVLIELESVTLSRDIPTIIKFVAQPIINAIARESMTRTLESVRARLTRPGAAAAGAGPQAGAGAVL
jgi:hypothetical protein